MSDLITETIKLAAQRPEQERYGQRLFNALYELDPEYANLIRATEADPFYQDDKAEQFFEKLLELTA